MRDLACVLLAALASCCCVVGAGASPRPSRRCRRCRRSSSRARVLPPERTRTEQEAREEIQRIPGAVRPRRRGADRRVARGQPQGRARLRAGRADPAALRRRRREPALDPRLGPAQQLPPARHQRPDRRLPLRQRRRLQRLRVARAADHQAHRGLSRAPTRSASAATRWAAPSTSSPRPATTPASSRCRSEGGSFGFFKNYLGTGQVYGPLDLYVGLQRHRAARATATTPSRSGAAPTAPSATALPGGTTLRFDLGFVAQQGAAAGRAHPAGVRPATRSEPNPASVAFAQEARNYDYTRGAFTAAHAARRQPGRSSGRPSSTTRTSTTRCPSPSSTTRPTAGSTELRWILAAPLFGRGNRLHRGLPVLRHAAERRPVRRTSTATAARMTKNQINIANNSAIYAEDQFDVVPAVIARGRRPRLQYATTQRARPLPAPTATSRTRSTSSVALAQGRLRLEGGARPSRSSATPATPTSRRCSSS